MDKKIVGSYTSFGKLKKALVGTFQPLNYFDPLPEGQFKDRMNIYLRINTLNEVEKILMQCNKKWRGGIKITIMRYHLH